MSLREGVLYRKFESIGGDGSIWQLVVPRKLRKEILHQLHDAKTAGHLGCTKTQSRVSNRFYWHGSKSDVTRYCQSCDLCASRRRPHKTPRAPMQTYTVGAPLERVAIDVLGPLPVSNSGNKFILVIGDYFTKWTEAYALPNQEAKTVAKVVVEEFVCRFGVPRQLHSDQGTNFQSAIFKEMCVLLDIDQTRTTPFHPISDGMIERYNSTLEAMLSKFVHDNQKDWDEHLPFMMMAYRTAQHDSTGVSPTEAMLGRQTEVPIDIVIGAPPRNEDELVGLPAYVQNLKDRLEYTHDYVRKSSAIATETQKRSYDHRATKHSYSVGDAVWLHTQTRKRGVSPKLTRPWQGPFTIIKQLSDVTYRIQKSHRSKPTVVHSNRLKPYKGRDPPTWFKKLDDSNPTEVTQHIATQTDPIQDIEEISTNETPNDHTINDEAEDRPEMEVDERVAEDPTDEWTEESESDSDMPVSDQNYEVVTNGHDRENETDLVDYEGDTELSTENLKVDSHDFHTSPQISFEKRRSERTRKHPNRFRDFVVLHDTECDSDEWEKEGVNNNDCDGDDEDSSDEEKINDNHETRTRVITDKMDNTNTEFIRRRKDSMERKTTKPERRSKRVTHRPDRLQY